jgi:hypothetical protein
MCYIQFYSSPKAEMLGNNWLEHMARPYHNQSELVRTHG